MKIKDDGGALLMALAAVALLIPLVAVSLEYTSSSALLARRDRDYTTANAACEATLEWSLAKWKSWIQSNGGNLPIVSDCIASGTVDIEPSVVQPFLDATQKFKGATVTALTIEPIDTSDTPVSSTLTSDEQKAKMLSRAPHPQFSTLMERQYTYRVSATISLAARGQTLTTSIRRFFTYGRTSVFQSLMWFDGDLELFPSPQMDLSGWIHTNSNLYICHQLDDASESLNMYTTVNGVRTPAVVSIAGKTANQGNSITNTVNEGTGSVETYGSTDAAYDNESGIIGLIYGVSYLQALEESYWQSWEAPVWDDTRAFASQVKNVSQMDPLPIDRATAINTTDTDADSPNNDSLREIIEPLVTAGGKQESTAFSDARYYNMADYIIEVNRDTSVAVADRTKVLDRTGTRIANTVAPATAIRTALGVGSDGNPSTTDFYDFREAGNVTNSGSASAVSTTGQIKVTNLDVSGLTTALNSLNQTTQYINGVVYFKDVTAGSNKRGIRLSKGGVLPTKGLTIVTADAAYIQGDYNTGTTYNGDGSINQQPASNGTTSNPSGGSATSNEVSGYSRRPAAVCADAVTFLSNGWVDVGATATTNSRVAAATTYNTAFMSGHVPTNSSYTSTSAGQTGNTRSGGAINFPRVLENWSGKPLTYWGSMVQMYDSQVMNTKWSQHIYGAPIRRWNYDRKFDQNPPPGPKFQSYTRGRFLRS